jgi:hypothetical protein
MSTPSKITSDQLDSELAETHNFSSIEQRQQEQQASAARGNGIHNHNSHNHYSNYVRMCELLDKPTNTTASAASPLPPPVRHHARQRSLIDIAQKAGFQVIPSTPPMHSSTESSTNNNIPAGLPQSSPAVPPIFVSSPGKPSILKRHSTTVAPSPSRLNSFRSAARKVQMINHLQNNTNGGSNSNKPNLILRRQSVSRNHPGGGGTPGHRSQGSIMAQDILESLQTSSDPNEGFSVQDTLILQRQIHPPSSSSAPKVETSDLKGSGTGSLTDDDDEDDRELAGEDIDGDTGSEQDDDDDDDKGNQELLPLRIRMNHGGSASPYGSMIEEIQETRHKKNKKRKSWIKRQCLLHPKIALQICCQRIMHSHIITIALPFFVASWIMFYNFGNPIIEWLPGGVSLAWWFDFFGRQTITFELAKITQWLILDKLLLGTKLSTRILGPLITMTALQARGWPFLVFSWACWDLLILHGDGLYTLHWFYWTGLRLYTSANSGSYILSSSCYFRLLLSMLLAGFATTVKRMVILVHFGKRLLRTYKSRLEKLLADIVLLGEIAELAEEAECIIDMENAKLELPDQTSSTQKNRMRLGTNDVTFDSGPDSDEESEDEGRIAVSREMEQELERTKSGRFLIREQLDRWEEPVNKLDKSSGTTLHDVLKFKRALTFMDHDTHPFGEAFGPASHRNECIESSNRLFARLIQLTPGSSTLSFEILQIVAQDEFGNLDESKVRRLRRLFQPDSGNDLSDHAFIQSCDSIYKKFRYFHASVCNSSVIDMALQNIVDGAYAFVLALILLAIMNFNPWPVLVSITSLLVSVSFALGSSVSKYVEGVLLIAVRRPFEPGDRIIISKPEEADSPGSSASWFVEDISLFYTTLRFAKTNEVSTLNNFSISQSRIVNLQRSTNAIVRITMDVRERAWTGNKFQLFRSEIEQYIRDHPRIWESLAACRHDDFQPDSEKITITLDFRHRLSWQNSPRISENRADLLRFVHQTAKKMGVMYSSTPSKRLVIHAGNDEEWRKKFYEEALGTENQNATTENCETFSFEEYM